MTTQTYELVHPVTTADGTELHALDWRRPKVKDLKLASQAAGNSTTEQSIHVIAYVTGQSVATIEELDIADFKALSECVGKLLA